MSRSHRFLVVALVVMGLLVGAARIFEGSPTPAEGALGNTTTTGAPVPTAPTTTVATVAATSCVISATLEVGSTGSEVQCLEQWLSANGYFTAVPDPMFDDDTATAVRSLQAAAAVTIDGVVGLETAALVGTWAGVVGQAPLDSSMCPATPHAVLVDRATQRAALCDDGTITYTFPITSARSQPDPNTYEVYAKDLNASSTLSGEYSTMTHFVAFTRGKFQGARIAFHSVPKYSDGSWVQPLDSVGTMQYYGASAGCIRVLPDDAVRIWDWLEIGDAVRVIS